MIDYKRLLCLKELLSLTMMCMSRDTLQCSLADKPNTELWVFKPVCASFTPLPAATHCLLPSRESQECLWEEKKQNRLILQHLEGGNGLHKLYLEWGGGWTGFSRGSFFPASPSCITANTTKEIFWKMPSHFTFKMCQTLLPSTHKTMELNLSVYANISTLIYVTLITSL